ncbi:polar growth protein [Gaertneriomyces sp. JEL0708]|nr:polar growth protein [Gaertneriomyces sp. JEL0708]
MEAAYSLDIPFYVYGKHAFHAEDHDEVAFNQGDPVLVLERDELYADGWWKGRNNKGQEGLFPMNFVSLQKPQQENRRSSLTHLVKALDDVSLDLNTTTASAPRISLDLNESSNRDAHPSLWSTPTVHRWLKTQNLAFAIPAFKLVDGKRLLELNLASLKELGIDSLGERMDLLHAILALKEEWITTGHLSSSPHHNNNHNHRSSVSASVSTPSNVDSGFADEDAALQSDPFLRPPHHHGADGESDVTDLDSPPPDLHRERLRKAASHFTLSDYFYGDDPLLNADGNTNDGNGDDEDDGTDRESQLETLRNTEINSGATSPRTLSGSGQGSPIPHGKPLPPRTAAVNNNETLPVRSTNIGGMIGIPLPPSTTTNEPVPSSSSHHTNTNTNTHNNTHHGSLTRSIHKSDDKEKDKDKRRSSSLFGMLGFGALHKKNKSSSIQSLSMLSIPTNHNTNNQNAMNNMSVSPTTTSPSTTISHDDDLLMDTLLHTPDFSGSLYVKIHNNPTSTSGKHSGKHSKQGHQKEVWKKRWCILGNDVLLICKHAPLSKANNQNQQSSNGMMDAYTHVVATVKVAGYKVLPLSSSETAVGGGFGFLIQPTPPAMGVRKSESGDASNSAPTIFFTSTSQYDTLTWINHLVRAATTSSSDETGETSFGGAGKARLRSLIPIKQAQKMGDKGVESNVESHVESGAVPPQPQLQQQRRGSVIRTSIMSEPDHDHGMIARPDGMTTTGGAGYHPMSGPTRNFNGGGGGVGVNMKPVGAGAGVFARDTSAVRHLPWE